MTVGPQELSDAQINEKLNAFDSVPLFMKTLPDEETTDPVLAALQNLAHEGTPDEVALNFKDQGNEYFKGRRYREALGFYTQGVDAKPEDLTLLEALLLNRAACNLELQNYGSVLRDCSKAITLRQSSSKAYYRSALALLALDRADEAIDCCARCQTYDPNNKAIHAALDKAIKAKAIKDKREAERQARLQAEQEAKRALNRAFKERNLIVVANPDGSENPYSPRFDPEDATGQSMIFPVFFLYPQYASSDVIPEFVEDTPFAEHLKIMFPPQAPAPQWDGKGEYVDGKLVIYAMTRNKRLLKVGKKMSLRDVCTAAKEEGGAEKDGLELKDGCITFVVLPKGSAEHEWVDEYKRLRDKN